MLPRHRAGAGKGGRVASSGKFELPGVPPMALAWRGRWKVAIQRDVGSGSLGAGAELVEPTKTASPHLLSAWGASPVT